MKIKKEDIPVKFQTDDSIMRVLSGYDGMSVAYHEIPAGTDITPLLEGLENNSCHCPHWGYLIEGAVRIKYDDGTEEVITTGDVFYLPPGHTLMVEEDMKFLDFSPEKELNEVFEHIGKKMAEMSE
jgi:hypothetical protein